MEYILANARNEFGAQSANLVGLRGAVAQEAAVVRVTLAETRGGMEVLYTNTKAEFLNIQDAIAKQYAMHGGVGAPPPGGRGGAHGGGRSADHRGGDAAGRGDRGEDSRGGGGAARPTAPGRATRR